MNFNLPNNKSRKGIVYRIISDQMRFSEFCRWPILKAKNALVLKFSGARIATGA
jgi:hypothetical protein